MCCGTLFSLWNQSTHIKIYLWDSSEKSPLSSSGNKIFAHSLIQISASPILKKKYFSCNFDYVCYNILFAPEMFLWVWNEISDFKISFISTDLAPRSKYKIILNSTYYYIAISANSLHYIQITNLHLVVLRVEEMVVSNSHNIQIYSKRNGHHLFK